MKGVSYVLLPYKKDKGIRAIKYLVMAWAIRARRSIAARNSARASRASNTNRGF